MNANSTIKLAHPFTDLSKATLSDFTVMTRAEGPWVYDSNGKRYYEGMSGLYSLGLGSNNKRLLDAIKAQLDIMPFYQVFMYKTTDVALELSERLIEVAPVPMARVMLQSSGSEANDTAIKLCWLYWVMQGKPERRKMIGRLQGYHGTGVATASLSGLPFQHHQYGLPLPGFLHADCPHYARFAKPGETEEAYASRLANSLEELILAEGPETIAAFFAEPVMGTGGVLPPPATYFDKVQAVLEKYKILFVVDEIINGFGRTGKMWASQQYNLRPDMMSSAKMLSSSYMPISALYIGQKVSDAMDEAARQQGFIHHGYTYGAHPVCAAAAIEVLNIYRDEKIVENAAQTGKYLESRLKGEIGILPIVGEVRGIGLMWAIELMADRSVRQNFDPKLKVAVSAAATAAERGLIVRPVVNDTLILAPPLIMTREDVDYVIDILISVIKDADRKFRQGDKP
ncbi:aminotransferase (plasmid) [Mesorhizobium sp. ORM8.1]